MGSFVGKVLGVDGEDAAGASLRGAKIAAQGEREKLDYLKSVEKLPLEIRDKFLPQLADAYSGGQGQQDLIDSAMNSPLYQQMLGNLQYGEDAIMRNASATGGLRSGDTNRALNEYNTRQRNEMLSTTYGQQLQGIQGLANMPLNTNAIGNATAAPSRTMAQGVIGAGQARADADQGVLNAIMGGAGLGVAAYSDIRAKENIKYLGERNGHNIYSWDWIPEAVALGLTGSSEGVLAHEVYEYMPAAISTEGGLLMVNYEMLGLGGIH